METLHYPIATSITYTSLMFCQFANIFSRRAGTASVFTSYIRSNKKLLLMVGISLGLIMTLIYIPIVHTYFSFGAMNLIDRLFPIIGGIVFLLIHEIKKYFQRKKLYNKQ